MSLYFAQVLWIWCGVAFALATSLDSSWTLFASSTQQKCRELQLFAIEDCFRKLKQLIDKSLAFTVMINDEAHTIELPQNIKPSIVAAAFCSQHPELTTADCYQLLRSFHQRQPREDQELYLSEPRQHYSYPPQQRIYFEFLEVTPQHVCLRMDGGQQPIWCGSLPLSEPFYITKGTIGIHAIVIETADNPSRILDAVFFTIQEPSVRITKTSENVVALAVENYDARDGDRVCILIDRLYLECNKLQDSAFNLQHHLNVSLELQMKDGRHSLQALVIDRYKKCVSKTETVDYDIIGSKIDMDRISPIASTPAELQCVEMLPQDLTWICTLEHYEYGIFSQNGEDGILQLILEKIGSSSKYFVEFGVEDGTECNTRFLREEKGWSGLMMDGGYENELINLKRAWISAEEINNLFRKYGVPSEFDVLSIDIDYNDFWVWKAINNTEYSPRVVIIEYNSHIPPEQAYTVEYEPNTRWDGQSNYFGAGIQAIALLGIEKGYSLVYCESHGVNCFLIRNDLLGSTLSGDLMISSIYKSPNFFGKGWSYPSPSSPHHWVNLRQSK